MNNKRPSSSRKSSQSRQQLNRADKDALAQLDHLLDLQRRREQLSKQVPPGIVTEQVQGERGAIIYRFSHQDLGPLGQLRITPVPYMNASTMDVDMAESDPEKDERWEEKYRMLKTVADLCIAALPGSHTSESPLPPMEEARKRRQLYLRFLACEHSIDMFGLAKGLSPADYELLLSTCEPALRTASTADRSGLEQRLAELRFYWNDLKERPTV